MIFKSHTDLTDLTDYFFRCKQRVFSSGLNGKTPKESRIREIREIRVGNFNIKHYNKVYGFTKLHQAGVSPALFSGFRPGRGKSPSDEMDSKMHPALRAVAEEWIQQELQGVQSSASILYFLPFGRTLIFISDNR